MHWILSPEPPAVSPVVPVIEDILVSKEYLSTDRKQEWLRSCLNLSPERIEEIALQTCGQRDNPLWAVARKHRLTASNFGTILSAIQKQSYTPTLWKRLLASSKLDSVRAISWGINHEATAIQEYRNLGAVVEETGIWLDECGILGASPDGLVKVPPNADTPVNFQASAGRDLPQPDIIEVKCPYSARDIGVLQACHNVPGFPLVITENGLQLKTTHDYYDQIQGQLHVMNKACCDLVVWTPLDLAIVRIPSDITWKVNISKLKDFYFNVYLHKLAS